MRFMPHAYQQHCIEHVLGHPAAGLFLDMGLGKTVITLSAVNELRYNRLEVNRTLVIAPKKVAEATWNREAAKWDHLRHLRIVPILGSTQKRIRALYTPGDIWVINRENVPWLVEYCRNAWPFDMVVCDEFSSFKNPSAQRTKALRRVRPHIQRIVGLTGTPAPNGLEDLWSQIYLLDQGERLGKSFTRYRELYFDPDKRSRDRIFSYQPRAESESEIRQRIGDICISLSAEDYLQLPECVVNDIPVALDSKAQAAYSRMEREALLEVDGAEITANQACALTGKLLQLCNGAVYDADHREYEIHNCKLEAFAELVESLQGQPLLVFYAFRHDLKRIHAALAKTGLRVRELASPADELAWNSREVDVLLAHPASAAYGLNLQDGGNHVCWFGLTWSLELYQQANKRLHRQGQKQRVIIHRLLVDGGADEDVATALESKGDTQDALLQALKARIERYKE